MGCCISRTEQVSMPKNQDFLPYPLRKASSRITSTFRENYIIIKIVGSGSLGNLLLVKDKRTGLERAAKELIKSMINSSGIDNFLSELAIIKNMDHPSIVRVYELIETTTRIYIITEFLSGGQLFEKLSLSERITERLAARYLNDIILALNHCHKNNIIHRDIKPENLLFESDVPDAHLKMIDFGISRIHKPSKNDIQASVGAIGYMAPERFKGVVSTKSDIWSAGVILYTILCGTPPFYAPTDAEAAKLITQAQISMTGPAWESISTNAKNLIKKMLKKEPKERPSAEEILSSDWLISYSRREINDIPIDNIAFLNLSKFNVSSYSGQK